MYLIVGVYSQVGKGECGKGQERVLSGEEEEKL